MSIFDEMETLPCPECGDIELEEGEACEGCGYDPTPEERQKAMDDFMEGYNPFQNCPTQLPRDPEMEQLSERVTLLEDMVHALVDHVEGRKTYDEGFRKSQTRADAVETWDITFSDKEIEYLDDPKYKPPEYADQQGLIRGTEE